METLNVIWFMIFLIGGWTARAVVIIGICWFLFVMVDMWREFLTSCMTSWTYRKKDSNDHG